MNDIRRRGKTATSALGVRRDSETDEVKAANTQDVGESIHVAKENCISLSTVHEE